MIKKDTYNIRFANILDAQSIAEIHVLSWQKAYSSLLPEHFLQALSVPERKQLWSGLMAQGVKILVIEINDQIVGFASIGHFRDTTAHLGQGEISAIYLHPTYWRNSLGKKLCMAAIVELENLGFEEIMIWVLKDNLRARLFYEHLGFTITNSIKTEEWI